MPGGALGDVVRVAGRLSRADGWARLTDPLWWNVLVVAALDVALTTYGLTAGLVELNPVAHLALTVFGTGSLVVIKLLALGVGLASSRALRPRRRVVPLMFLVCWGAAVLSNAVLIANTP